MLQSLITDNLFIQDLHIFIDHTHAFAVIFQTKRSGVRPIYNLLCNIKRFYLLTLASSLKLPWFFWGGVPNWRCACSGWGKPNYINMIYYTTSATEKQISCQYIKILLQACFIKPLLCKSKIALSDKKHLLKVIQRVQWMRLMNQQKGTTFCFLLLPNISNLVSKNIIAKEVNQGKTLNTW